MKNSFFYKYSHIFLAVLCATAFFIHETIADVPEPFEVAKNKFLLEKSKKINLLNEFKATYENTDEYRAYYKQKIKSDNAWKEFKEVEENITFLGFEDVQQFLGEFGWAFGLLLYAFFNFINTYQEPNRARKGKLFLHFTLITISLYFIYWTLYQHQDFEKITYVIFSIITSILIAFGIHLIQRKRYIHYKSYQLNHQDLIGFMLENTKPEKEEDMWNVLKKIKHERE